MSEPGTVGSSPYATGGGGVVLEHEYGAAALASLLLGQPVEGLGDEFTPTQVSMQQEACSPVDDVVVRGVSPGGERALRVACRRRPTLGKSNEPTVALFADFVQVVITDATALDAGQLRLALAVVGPFGPAAELAALTEIARRQPTREQFQSAVDAPGAHSAGVRSRLSRVDEIIGAALERVAPNAEDGTDAKGLSWKLLRGLYVIQLQLEGDAAPGRTQLVARLQALTGDTARAEQLRLRLVEIASQGAIRAGVFTRLMLRRELRPFSFLGASPDYAAAEAQVTLLETELQRRTQRSLPALGAVPPFTLDRSARQAELARTITSAPAGAVVLVHGEPDVGKSALALATVDSVRGSGGAALVMSLRDLPRRAVDLKAALGLGPVDLLAAAPSAPVSVLLLDGAEVLQEGESGALTALLDAASSAGLTVVLVSRDDAAGSVRELLRVLGFTLGERHDAQLAYGALAMALAVRGGQAPGVVFHTGQGSEYTARPFQAACQRLGVTQSMGRPGSALDNAVIESWHSTLEFELRSVEHFTTKAAARTKVAAWIEDYNTNRRHRRRGFRSDPCGALRAGRYQTY